VAHGFSGWSRHRVSRTVRISRIAITIMQSSTDSTSCITFFGGGLLLRSLGTHQALETQFSLVGKTVLFD
jgi:hypothetical protein